MDAIKCLPLTQLCCRTLAQNARAHAQTDPTPRTHRLAPPRQPPPQADLAPVQILVSKTSEELIAAIICGDTDALLPEGMASLEVSGAHVRPTAVPAPLMECARPCMSPGAWRLALPPRPQHVCTRTCPHGPPHPQSVCRHPCPNHLPNMLLYPAVLPLDPWALVPSHPHSWRPLSATRPRPL